MKTFYEKEGESIFGGLIRQGFEPDSLFAQKILLWEEKNTKTDVGIAIASTTTGLVCSAGIIALSGFTIPLFVSVGALALSAVQAWNSRVTQAEREEELEFLQQHGEAVEKIVKDKLQFMTPAAIADAYEICLNAFETSTYPLKALGTTGSVVSESSLAKSTDFYENKITTEESVVSEFSPQHNAEQLQFSPVVTVNSKKTGQPAWVANFIHQTALLWGNQGSGKSWMGRYLAKIKKEQGYRVIVIDPDSNRAEWKGVESYHSFEDIASFMAWYIDELTGRYEAYNDSNMEEDDWRKNLWKDGRAIAVICEEVTTYVDLISDKKLVEKFIRLALTKSRKQEMPITFVAHNNTQLALGNIKGLSSLISKMLQLQLKAEVDSVSLKPVSSGKGEVKLDSSDTWLPVLLPRFDKKITNFGSPINPKNSVQTIQITNSECAENVEGKLEEAERAIIEVLTKSPRHTLWEIATEEFEIQDAETVKDFLEKIGELIINKELVSLSDKFKIQSRTDVRYSYSGYSKKVAQTHRKANNKCCCCSKKKSEQIHHTRYEGANDEPGINLFPVCLDCHKTICHSPQNWSQNPVWGSQNTPEFCDRLKLEFSFLVSQDC